MRELVVVRHGESEGNRDGIAQGRLPFPLTAEGRAQCERAAGVLARFPWRLDAVVTSPLPRCVESAAILARALRLPPPREDDAFVEIDCGEATGRPYRDLLRERPELFLRPASEWLGFHEVGGESDAQLVARVGAGLERLPAESRVLLVTHGAVFKGVLASLLGITTQVFLDLRLLTCMRIERRQIGTSDVHALTHFFHPGEAG